MKKGIVYSGAIITIAVVLLSACGGPVQVQDQVEAVAISESAKQILDATISITLHMTNPENPAEYLSARGLSTVLATEDGNVLVTHDHWGGVLDNLEFARIWTRDNELLQELSAEGFRELIQYRDGGTLILSAPEGLIPDQLPTLNNPAALPAIVPAAVESESLPVGTSVTVVVRRPDSPHRVEIVEAVVEAVENEDGPASLTLRNLNGKQIEPGDSGGGIWLNGKLVGNLWYRVKNRVQSVDENGSVSESLRLTDLAIAASYPL